MQFRMRSHTHIDLSRYVLGRLGYKGGLKQIEQKFGLQRKGPIAEVDGSVAPLLWRRYNLQALMEKAYALSLKKIPIHVRSSKASRTPLNLPKYDPDFVSDLLRRNSF